MTAPDLVIEVLSPLPRIGDLSEKVGWYAKYGVRECWLVHQRSRTVDVLGFDSGRISGQRTFSRRDDITSTVLSEFRRSLDSMLP